jgi:hypothetical protein
MLNCGEGFFTMQEYIEHVKKVHIYFEKIEPVIKPIKEKPLKTPKAPKEGKTLILRKKRRPNIVFRTEKIITFGKQMPA